MKWMISVVFVGLLWISPTNSTEDTWKSKVRTCLKPPKSSFVVPDDFNGVNDVHKVLNNTNERNGCIVFLRKNGTRQGGLDKSWPHLMNNVRQLSIHKWHLDNTVSMKVVHGKNCSATSVLTDSTTEQCVSNPVGPCYTTCIEVKQCKESVFDENVCSNFGLQKKDMNMYMFNLTRMMSNPDCINCNSPVKKAEKILGPDEAKEALNVTFNPEKGGEVDSAQAAQVMNKMSNLAESINASSVELSLADGITGILLREPEPEDITNVYLGYGSPDTNINIVDSNETASQFSRSVFLPQQAFKKSLKNDSVPFAACLRFTNLTKDEKNSTVLNDEVVAIEMGATIRNLTNRICLDFRKLIYKGIPSCRSWNGEGGRPNWTDEGCETDGEGENITCCCSHLTFFAILLAPLNETISSTDLSNLTVITQVGCGLSMFFLAIVLFMHFLLRRAKASKSTRILIHLVAAMFLLNLTFLTNSYIAKLKHEMGCKIMAALMHYFMLATFTWFAVQAFHLCFQLYMEGKIVIHRYVLKLSIASWVFPSIVGVILLSIGKYGEQGFYTSDTAENVAMCWITDSDVHYVVNIGYYALVFIFTFTTFIIILSWFFCLKKTNAANAQISKSGKSIVTILGLCCMLGITWGFAFFAHGAMQIPSYYIFTILNSFQGFFLFIYYYNSRHSADVSSAGALKNLDLTSSSSSSTSTLKSTLDSCDNPYMNTLPKK